MLFHRRRARGQSRADDKDIGRAAIPNRPSSLTPYMSSQEKSPPASRPYSQLNLGSSPSRDYQSRLANRDSVESGLRKHPLYPRNVQMQSQDPENRKPGNLAIHSTRPEHQLQSSTPSAPRNSTNSTVGRRRPDLALQHATLPRTYTHTNTLTTIAPQPKPVSEAIVVGGFSASRLVNPPSPRKVGQERRSSSAKPGFIKLDVIPLSPLNLDFVDLHQVSTTPADTSDRHGSEDPGSYSTRPQSPVVRPVFAGAGSRPTLSFTPMRRRPLSKSSGLATKTPSPYSLPEGRNTFGSSTSLTSVLANAASTGAETDKGVGSSEKRKTGARLSFSALQLKAEQDRFGPLSEPGHQQLGEMKLGTQRIANFSPVAGYKRRGKGGNQTQFTTILSKNGIRSRDTGRRRPTSMAISNVPDPTLSSASLALHGTQDALKDNLSIPIKAKRQERFSFGDRPGTACNRKRLSILRELIEEPLDDYDLMREVSSSHSQVLKDDSWSQQQRQNTHTQYNAASKACADDIIDTSDDPSVNRVSEGSEIKDISGLDSGVVSPSSSHSSPGSLSQTDSGYSSSSPIQSKRAVADSGFPDKVALEGLSERDAKNESDDRVGIVGHQTTDDSIISLSRGSMRLLSTLIRPRHGLCISGIDDDDDDDSHLNSKRPSSINDTSQPRDSSVSQESAVNPRVRSNSGPQLAGKLQRLFAHQKEDDLSTGFASHDLKTVPTVPVDVEERLSEHNRVFPTSPKKLTRHSKRSTESLKTIVSVDSAAAYSESNYSQDDHCRRTCRLENSPKTDAAYKGRMNINSLDSPKSLYSLASSGAVKSLSSLQSTKSNSSATGANDTKMLDSEALPDGSELERANGDEGHVQRTTPPLTAIRPVLPANEALQDVSIGDKPVPPPRNPFRISRQVSSRQSMLPTSQIMIEDSAPDETSAALRAQDSQFVRDEGVLPASLTRRTQLGAGLDAYSGKATASAPNLLYSLSSKTEAVPRRGRRLTVADLTKELPPEPPREEILRSSFSKRPWQQRRLAARSGLQSSNQENERSYECHHDQVRSQTTTAMSPEQTQVVQDYISVFMSRRRHSALAHRPAFSESLAIASVERPHPKEEPRPPYRVLHSYNSPAYKNIPIWA
ncbi:uncharacterized protein MAM_07907 [Metarhizium album ARSEF 1941]|uniref:Proteophosphoglycan ppg4 n=1 Tax=Metarhizium album (strain ARSEF 1941) TaxID=1081103 RepID=A0A0B2WEL7_METAS|nr:uncharacterized protein MAM_07907 [Metarhizium album ARSEF 1941]KHN94271.1 hypothetical protein MAM_07907 [Metarhizium album ARSEF 1941]